MTAIHSALIQDTCIGFGSLLIHSQNAKETFILWFLNYLFNCFSDLIPPAIVVLNTSNQEYFLPHNSIENIEDMVHFINEILEGVVEVSLSL